MTKTLATADIGDEVAMDTPHPRDPAKKKTLIFRITHATKTRIGTRHHTWSRDGSPAIRRVGTNPCRIPTPADLEAREHARQAAEAAEQGRQQYLARPDVRIATTLSQMTTSEWLTLGPEHLQQIHTLTKDTP